MHTYGGHKSVPENAHLRFRSNGRYLSKNDLIVDITGYIPLCIDRAQVQGVTGHREGEQKPFIGTPATKRLPDILTVFTKCVDVKLRTPDIHIHNLKGSLVTVFFYRYPGYYTAL